MRLRITTPDGQVRNVPCEAPSFTIGRGADADIRISDRSASRVHCELAWESGHWIVRDRKSLNGTWINGRRVAHRRLQAGDRLLVGDTAIEIVDAPAKGVTTLLREVKHDMDRGKGYHTILHDIVGP